jgi:hypothetical protein
MPSIIQTAFALEAFVNLPTIIGLLFFPSAVLKLFIASPIPSLELNATTTFLARSLGGLVLSLTPQLLLAYPNSKDCAAKRKLAYVTLGTGEVALVPLLLWEAFRASDQSKAAGVSAGGLTTTSCLVSVANLTPLLAWRIYVFLVKPQWFGDTENVMEKGKKKA